MKKIAIIGLGYVGLPVAVAFSAKHKVTGFDINKERIDDFSSFNEHSANTGNGNEARDG